MEWYIDTMITLIERGGEFVTRDVWHSTVQLVSGCLACDRQAPTCVCILHGFPLLLCLTLTNSLLQTVLTLVLQAISGAHYCLLTGGTHSVLTHAACAMRRSPTTRSCTNTRRGRRWRRSSAAPTTTRWSAPPPPSWVRSQHPKPH